MKLSECFEGVSALGVETAPFIYFVEQHVTYGPLVNTIFGRAQDRQIQIITSVITLLEVLSAPMSEGRHEVQQAYRKMLLRTPQIATLPVNTAIAEQAALIRANYRLRTPDALHIATAIVAGCEAFLTNDHALKRVRGIHVLILDELEPDPNAL